VEKLADIDGIAFMPEPEYGRANRWLTCVTIDPARNATSPEVLRRALEQENIESRPLWKPMHLQPVFSECPACVNGVSERLFREGLCLPSGTSLSNDDLERIIACVEKVFGV
jgi:pyridoxal phosphate-dependent aminotransferase EpsN